jgi:hypothetical protein
VHSGGDAAAVAPAAALALAATSDDGDVTFLTYNVWFEESVALKSRMRAIVSIVRLHRPHVLALQEVTQNISDLISPELAALGYRLFRQPSIEDGSYGVMLCTTLPAQLVRVRGFKGSIMRRALVYAVCTLPGGGRLVVGTAHLESVLSDAERRAPERHAQMVECFRQLAEASAEHGNAPAVLLGDVNWTDPVPRGADNDGKVPIPPPDELGRVWREVEYSGFSYDQQKNGMLPGSKLRYKSDRGFVLPGNRDVWNVRGTLVGTDPLPGETRTLDNRYSRKTSLLPVLPSDHFGVLFTVPTIVLAQQLGYI